MTDTRKRQYTAPVDSERCVAQAVSALKGEGCRCMRRRVPGRDLCSVHQPKEKSPKVGDTMQVHGQSCRIFKVRPFGTVDVVTLDGLRAFRVSGLGFHV